MSLISKIKPYFELMRLDKRIGIYLILWPCLWSIAISAKGTLPYFNYILFALGAVIMRGAGCVINDIIDRRIDAEVERTKNRPLASGRIKLRHAVIFLVGLLTAGLAILLQFNDTTKLLGFLIIVPIFIYPFMKRVTYWPQAFLGLTFNWGALMGAASIKGEITFASIMLYIACFCWTMGYDTIYAHQDKEFDVLLGLKSTAIKFSHYTKKYLSLFYGIMILCLWIAGVSADLGISYHAVLILGGLHLLWQIYDVKLDQPADCLAKFRSNFYFGFIIFAGIISGY